MQEGDRVGKQRKTVKAMLKKWPQYIKMNPRRKSGYPEILLVKPKADGDKPKADGDKPKNTTRKVKKISPL
jgi:hypothetical protein